MINSDVIQSLIASVGTGIGKKFDINKCRYDKVIMMCFTGDTKIKLLNGTSPTFIELIEMEKENPNQVYWVYSKNEQGDIVPGRAYNPRITSYVDEIIKLTLDNGEVVKCTKNHLFMLKDGTYKEAQYLTNKDSLMPLYTKYNDNKFYNNKRELIYNDKTNKWEFTHLKVYKHFNGDIEKHNHIHHLNKNYLDNDPNNLEKISSEEHFKRHKKSINNLIARQQSASIKITKYNKSQKHSDTIKQKHKDGIYTHTYFGNNGYNESEKHSQDIKNYFNNNPQARIDKAKIITEYNHSEQNKQSTAVLNKREDIKQIQWRSKYIHLGAYLILIGYDLGEHLFIDKRYKKELRDKINKIPTINTINKYFNSFDEFKILSKKYLEETAKDILDNVFEKFNNIDKLQEERKISNIQTRKNAMAKIGKIIFDRNLDFNEYNFENIKKEIGAIRVTKYVNYNKYFNTEDEFKEYCRNYNHKIINREIVKLQEKIPVYDISVENYHNFALNNGVFCHNCDADVDGCAIRL